MNIDPTQFANPYESNNPYSGLPSVPPSPPKTYHKRIIAVSILVFILVTVGTGLASYNAGVSSIQPITPTPIDIGSTATAAYNQGIQDQNQTDSGIAQATATAAYNQGSADDNASTLKWLHDKCTKDGNGNYSVFVKDGQLWCY